MLGAMRKLAASLLVMSGCYVGVNGHVRGPNPVAVAAAVATVAVAAAIVATAPPPAVEVEYYDYGHNPGQVWVNGRYAYVNNGWVWQAGHWQA